MLGSFAPEHGLAKAPEIISHHMILLCIKRNKRERERERERKRRPRRRRRRPRRGTREITPSETNYLALLLE